MTILLDLENNITNESFAWWVENFKLDYVAIIDGEVHTCSDYCVPNMSELDDHALSVFNQISKEDATPFTESFAAELISKSKQMGYDLSDVAANPLPYIKGLMAKRERERQQIAAYLIENKEAFMNGTIENRINADFAA